jgi:hypothetical protein
MIDCTPPSAPRETISPHAPLQYSYRYFSSSSDNPTKNILSFLWYGTGTVPIKQGCGSGSGLDPDSATLWIRIHIGNPDLDPWARKLRNFSGKNALYSYFFKKILPLKRYNYFLKKIWMNNTSIFDLI